MNLGPPELIIVLAVFVLLFGAKKLPELGSSFGKSIQNFKRGINEAKAEEDAEADDEARADDEDRATAEDGSSASKSAT